VRGAAVPLPSANIDTDVIMPKQFLKGIDRSGLRDGLFYDLRFPNGQRDPRFVLNRPEWNEARFLVVGPNFGCGSSREHAVWGLLQFGIRALIGTTFAGIFFDNCTRNGLAALSLPLATHAAILRHAQDPSDNWIEIEMMAQEIRTAGATWTFEIETARKEALHSGLDLIARTLLDSEAIRAFESAFLNRHAWSRPVPAAQTAASTGSDTGHLRERKKVL